MKKLTTLVLALMMLIYSTACSNKTDKKDEIANSDAVIESDGIASSDGEIASDADINSDEEKAEENNDGDKKEEGKPSQNKPDGESPQSKPETSAPQQTPTPESKPENTAKTIGTSLLADFNAKANSYSDAQSLADAISKNSVIEFMPVVESVSQGLLTGFGNAQITGFKDGAKFAPMIGTIPFIGYVFVLEDGMSASSFISTLRANADPSWNICTTADETITGSVGNKVFFVMSPKSFE